ncbi:uncharacterized protein LOC126672334 [Mercurialis annua]|uniref:uncharacterized protein LOC126672334 n=1 Tax=Mercurialis annua TaxID=3986 RepID=UPI00215FC100|nr:uncharacterized protein LOC126672334 [Mercurialis annua]
MVKNISWCIFGDFNDILALEEKRGGASYPTWLLSGFRNAVMKSGLIDLGASGHKFTWFRGRDIDTRIEERLDRVLCNNSWLEVFLESLVHNMELTTSDPLPILLSIKRYQDEDCVQVIRGGWVRNPIAGIMDKLNGVRDELKRLSGAKGPNFKKRIDRCRKAMAGYQARVDTAGVDRYNCISSECHVFFLEEKKYWKQCSKCHWLREGDANTRFFFIMRLHQDKERTKWRGCETSKGFGAR